ncbi:MAG: SAVED domain-containing protein, partial [Thermomicrobiales bacterium]
RQAANYELETRQGPMVCRTDLAPSPDFRLVSEVVTEGLDGPDVAIGISITNDLTQDVLDHLRRSSSSYGAVLLLRPDRPFGSTALRSPEDMVALAESVKQISQRFVRERRAQHLGLFYLGPFAGALFIGHRLNAVARAIQVFEDAAPGYAPSFLLQE